ncbi:Cardiomyopathy-associated protein [Heracleum sosnowskyi]|uniref:Cardiomyopathy-associated protein n=1 Tax=Heracleum sosnowskyi TaxID=360622 RepID=A0AAD8I3G0_9APIA|nr:Cardiomyopathy-associated protein [Heracleum sosnowskyi]
MPPSPEIRRSPGRELKADSHKRGHSLKSGICFREKDENLALFDELQSSETDNFLLQSDDDFEDAFATKLSSFSDHKLGISPTQGESSDILNVEEGKNDYDWLMTPPDTPLFTFLDDETSPLDLAQRGRPRSLPISISGSSTIEKSRRSSKGSASPNRLSSSPRSGNSTVQKRGRTSLTPQSSPTPSSQHATPSRRSSPPGKPSQSAPRSSTPTPRRSSTSCIEGSRGPSPVKTSRGNSASPKMRAWQSNIPGFSLEAPPNLRTSLADRPASFVRGSSPASCNGQDSSTRSSRQSLSPTASKSVSSSHSHIQDPLSSHRICSVASSDNYDAESLLSISVGTSDSSPARRVGSLPNNRAPNFSKKLPRAGVYNSTSKRSLDYELRQMDQRKSPQNMFRPLLSSVPSSTFYSGKTSAAHHAILSRNSVTASSTTSSDLATSGTHYTEAVEQNQEDTSNACANTSCLDAQDEVFTFDKDDPLNENIVHETQDGFGEFDGGGMAGCDIQAGLENQSNHDTAMSAVANFEAFDVKAAALEVDGQEYLVLCSNCGQQYCSCESLEEDLTLCPDCRSDVPAINNIATSTIVNENSPIVSTLTLKHSESVEAVDSTTAEPKSSGVTGIVEPVTNQHEDIVGETRTSYDESIWNFLSPDFLSRTLVEEGVTRHANQQVVGQPIASYCSLPDGNTGGQHSLGISTAEVDASGGAGISVLLNRSSSCKGAYLQSRSFTASSISYDDPSYVRDSAYSSRVSHGHASLSASSSFDWGSCRQTNTRLQRQSSGRKSDFEISKYDKGTTHRRARSSFSGISNHGFQPSGLAISILECSDISLSQRQSNTDVNLIAKDEPALSSRNIEEDDACKFVEKNDDCRTVDVFATESSSDILNIDGDGAFKFVENNDNCRTVDVFATESSTDILNMHLEVSPDTPFTNSEESIIPENGKDLANDRKNIGNVEVSTIPVESSFIVKETMPSSFVEKVEAAEVPAQSLLEMETETKIENVDEDSSGAQSDAFSLDSKISFGEATAEKDTKTLLAEFSISDQKNCTPEGKDGSKARSMTLEEVTDTILFCSSIIQKISYDAATIAVENGSPALFEGSRPMVTILGKKDPERKDPHGRIAVKRTLKPKKAERPVETDLEPPNSSNDEEEITDASETRIVGISNIGDSNMKAPSKLESKCNCTVM